MARSRKLGHCVCNPKKPCPCDILTQHNVCPCAGEKLPVKAGRVALTHHVRKAGCASKIGQADLLRILSKLPPLTDPNVLIGSAAGDDAGVYKISDEMALVQTVDVFTPCVDDPYLFGQIAAANSLSDVYAMGGKPLTALSVVGFPIDDLDGAIMEKMLQGGVEKLEEAGCSLLGGHSINDEEVKCGFAITGVIDPGGSVARNCAKPGDALVLTKPLGTGMISFAAQIDRVSQQALAEVGESMATLNKDAAELMVEFKAHACTDVTGYALAGHLAEMIRTSGVSAEIDLSRLPVFAAARMCLAQEILGGAIERNQEYSMAWIDAEEGEAAARDLPILYDPQTSGGLLVSLPEKQAEAYVAALKARGHESASIIGRVLEKPAGGKDGRVKVMNCEIKNVFGSMETGVDAAKVQPPVETVPQPEPEQAGAVKDAPAFEPCCDNPPEFDDEPEVAAEQLFKSFMAAANKPGRVDGRAKKLIAVALSLVRNCEPCAKSHLLSAREMGITREELDEAANLAVEFGGCPVFMFYKEMLRKLKM